MEFEKIKGIIAEQLSEDVEKITLESSFTDDLGADSLDLVELIMALEEAYGIEIPDDAAESIKTVQDAVDYVEKNKE